MTNGPHVNTDATALRRRSEMLRHRESATARIIRAIEKKIMRLSAARDERLAALKNIRREFVLADRPIPSALDCNDTARH